jgi:transposase
VQLIVFDLLVRSGASPLGLRNGSSTTSPGLDAKVTGATLVIAKLYRLSRQRGERQPLAGARAQAGRRPTRAAGRRSPLRPDRGAGGADPRAPGGDAGHHRGGAAHSTRRPWSRLWLRDAAALFRAPPDHAQKKTAHASEQDRPDVLKHRQAWFDAQPDLDPERLVFIDETWAKTNMARTHGRASRGERLRVGIPHGHWKTTTVVAALSLRGMLTPFVLSGPINRDALEA